MIEQDKIKQAKCRILLKDYEELLKEIIDNEEQKMSRIQKLGNSSFEIAKDVIFNSGVIEGMKCILAKINELAQKE